MARPTTPVPPQAECQPRTTLLEHQHRRLLPGVALVNEYGPTETTIEFQESCQDYLVVYADATVEGLHIRANNFEQNQTLVRLWDHASCEEHDEEPYNGKGCGESGTAPTFQFNIVDGGIDPQVLFFAAATDCQPPEAAPSLMPGPTAMNGTRVLCSYIFCLPKSPWRPTAKPWSALKKI